MPHDHGPAPRADAAIPRAHAAPAPRSQAVSFSLLRLGLAPRLAAAAVMAASVWALIGWAMA